MLYDFSNGLVSLFSDEKQREIQRAVITEFAEDMRGIDAEVLLNHNCFYVPNDEFMIYFWGNEITDPKYGIYNGSQCRFYKRVIYPIYDFRDRVISFVGYTDEKIDGVPKYLYQPKRIFNKGKFIFMRKSEYIKAKNDGYVCVTDGLMDKFRFNSMGMNSSAQMATILTEEQKCYYEFIDRIIIPYDNDPAGKMLLKMFTDAFPMKTSGFYQNYGHDFDDFMKVKGNREKFMEEFNHMKRTGFNAYRYDVQQTMKRSDNYRSSLLNTNLTYTSKKQSSN